MKLYLLLIVVTIFFPLVLSFDKRVHFYTQFKALFAAIIVIGSGFVAWDIWFTKMGIWGFNPEHLIGVKLFNLPIEEVLFFVVVPFACVFIHNVTSTYFPRKTDTSTAKNFTYLWIVGAFVLSIINFDHYYTVSATFLSGLTALFLLKKTSYYISNIWRTFIIVVIPFLIINGALTGSFTNTPVVWYNDAHNLGLRILTIPVDDLFYNFTLIIGIILLRDYFQTKFKKSAS